MRRTILILFLVAAAIAFGQELKIQVQGHAPMEMMSVFPRETQPGTYQQVEPRQLQTLADQGWELVSVMPYVYRNEERNNGVMNGPKPMVTQTYPAYFFKRAKALR